MLPKITQRVFSGVLIGLATMAGVFWANPWVVWLVLVALCAVTTLEFYAMLSAARIPNFRIMGMLGGVALITATCLSLWDGHGRSIAELDGLVIFLLTVGVFLRQFPQKNNAQPLETIAGTLLGFFYIAFLLNFIAKTVVFWGIRDGRWLVLYFIFVVKFTDIGAFFIGCLFGRHKLIPRISPAKTWEGVAGGLLTGWAVSLLFLASTKGLWGAIHMTVVDACVLGLVLPLSGILGDLTESLFKRAAGVKDSSRLVSGMGGFLDVLDSLLFSAPVVYYYSRFFM